MKKTLLSLIAAGMILSTPVYAATVQVPVTSEAQFRASLLQLIQNLLAQVAILQQKLNEQIAREKASSTIQVITPITESTSTGEAVVEIPVLKLTPNCGTGIAQVETITTSYAKVYGSCDPQGNDLSYWFEYTGPDGVTRTTDKRYMGQSDPNRLLSYEFYNLQANSTYQYTLVAEYQGGMVRGNTQIFTTKAVAQVNRNPVVTPLPHN